MPYKDPDRKRQWEREHREQRNARRRIQHQDGRAARPAGQKPASDRISAQVLQEKRRITAEIARRRVQGLVGRSPGPVFRRPVPDPNSDPEPKSTWTVVKEIGGLALVVGIALLAIWGELGGLGRDVH